jgi:hypothetical protein
MNAKPFQVGDQVWPGGVVADIPDLSSLEMEGKVEEIDRGRIAIGQEVRVRIDSLPELTIPALLGGISPLTEQSFEDWPPTRSFRAYARMTKIDPRLRPSMNGSMDVVMSRIRNATSVPAKSVFALHGKPVVYVAQGGAYRPLPIEVLARNPDEIAIRGVPAGAMVTLVEPPQEVRP